jgi:hypothetical protein
MTGFDPVLARAAVGFGAEQSPLEERVADVDQQAEFLLWRRSHGP